MCVGQFLVQNAPEHQQPAPVMVAPGHLGTDDNFSCLAFGTGEYLAGHCIELEFQDFTGRLAGVVPDGAHESFRIKGVSFYLCQSFLPAAGQFHIRHKHLLHCLVEIHSLFGRYDALAGTCDIIAADQCGDDGGTGGRRADTHVFHGLLRLVVRDVPAAGLHSLQQSGFRVKRFGQSLFLC